MDLTEGVITSSFHVNETTHVENVRYGRGSNAMGLLAILQVDGGGPVPRWAKFLGQTVAHPAVFLRSLSKRRWSERTIIALVMQTTDNSINVRRRRGLFGARLTSSQGYGAPNPTYIPEGNAAVRAWRAGSNRPPASEPSRDPASARSSTSDDSALPRRCGDLRLARPRVIDPYHRLELSGPAHRGRRSHLGEPA